jgi:hypothetical protein
LKLSNVTDDIKTSKLWSDAAKVHVTKFFSSDVWVEEKDADDKKIKKNKGLPKAIIDKWLADNSTTIKCTNTVASNPD